MGSLFCPKRTSTSKGKICSETWKCLDIYPETLKYSINKVKKLFIRLEQKCNRMFLLDMLMYPIQRTKHNHVTMASLLH